MLTITPARGEEIETIWPMVTRAVTHMNALGNPQWGEDYPTRSHYETDLSRGELYAAREEGHILGVVCLNSREAPEYASLPWRYPGPALVIHRMAVGPEAQGRGVGRALFTFAEAEAKARGLGTIRADTYACNTRMQALFRGLGYEDVGFVRFGRPSREEEYPCFEKRLTRPAGGLGGTASPLDTK